jgi:hypothetical protein
MELRARIRTRDQGETALANHSLTRWCFNRVNGSTAPTGLGVSAPAEPLGNASPDSNPSQSAVVPVSFSAANSRRETVCRPQKDPDFYRNRGNAWRGVCFLEQSANFVAQHTLAKKRALKCRDKGDRHDLDHAVGRKSVETLSARISQILD